jgi:hypothetical protein
MVLRCNVATQMLEVVHQPTGNTALGLSSIFPEEPLVTILKTIKAAHFLIQLMNTGIYKTATEITARFYNGLMGSERLKPLRKTPNMLMSAFWVFRTNCLYIFPSFYYSMFMSN